MFTNIAKGWSLQRKWFSWQNIGNSLILNDVYITSYVDSLYNKFYLLIEYANKNSEGPLLGMLNQIQSSIIPAVVNYYN